MNDEFSPATISQRDWNELQGEVARLRQLHQINQKEIDDLKARLGKKQPQTGPQYRVVEFAPEGGRRHAKRVRSTLLITRDKAEVKKFIHDYWEPNSKTRKPFAELNTYLGQRRVYEYELYSGEANTK